MPIIAITGLDRKREACHFLIADLKAAVAGIKELEVAPEKVRPYIFDSTQEERTEVIAIVKDLFEKDVRDAEVRQHLADVIYGELEKFIKGSDIAYVSGITVIIHRIDPKEDGYRSERIHW